MKSFDTDNVPPSRLRKLRRLIRSKGLEPARVKKAAAAAEGLCRWVLGVEGYCRATALEASGALSKGTLRQAWEAEQQTDESWHLVTEDDIEPPAPVAPPPQSEEQAAAAWRAAVLAKEDIHAQLAVLEPIVDSLEQTRPNRGTGGQVRPRPEGGEQQRHQV